MKETIWQGCLALSNRLRCEEGASLTEYAVLLAFIVLLVVAAVAAFGDALSILWQESIVGHWPQ